MSNRNRSRDQGITERHARTCASRTGWRVRLPPHVPGAGLGRTGGRRITRTFATITAARQWREDARSALRAGTLNRRARPDAQGGR
jgi:hypothetical protein